MLNDPVFIWLIGTIILLFGLFLCARKWTWAKYSLFVTFLLITLIYLLWRSFFYVANNWNYKSIIWSAAAFS